VWSFSRPPAPRSLALACALAAGQALGCGGGSSNPDARAPAADVASTPMERAFRYESLDEHEVSSRALRGRATIIVFAATYGDASLVQTRFVQKVHAEHTPRVNAAAVFLEPVENRPLVRVFCNSLDLRFPAAMADAETIQGKGAFTGLNTVPSTVVLDAQGREVWRKVGVAPPDELRAALRRAQAASDL
jgi:hypothetical protein